MKVARTTEEFCHKCGKKIEKGELTENRGRVSSMKSRLQRVYVRKIYHWQCWQSLFYDSKISEKEIDAELQRVGWI